MSDGGFPADVQRQQTLHALEAGGPFDAVVVGGGATGLGVALDAALRGLRVALLERGDFGQGTSSRSTKLVHGGVRYLAQGNLTLVHEALRERARLLANAPHLARPLPFVMPAYRAWQLPFYGAGLMAYDRLAGRAGIGRTRWLGAAGVRERLPTVRADGLLGGVAFWDGQFDDARLAVALARTAQQHGALLANHCAAQALHTEGGRVAGVEAVDAESGRRLRVRAPCVINAAGVWVGQLFAAAANDADAAPPATGLVTPSQGVHLSFDRALLPTDTALFWPRTRDGRVLFAIPWLGKTLVGTTDSPRADVPVEPRPLPGEVDYLLDECARFFERPPTRADIRSIWVGLRPLIRPPDSRAARETQAISREHTVRLREDGLVTVTGGKWTTYRSMAQDVLDRCEAAGLLPRRGPCRTADTRLVGAQTGAPPEPDGRSLAAPGPMALYGDEADRVRALPGARRVLAPGLTEAMVRFAVRHEHARCVEDVLARRSRLLFLDAAAALDAAGAVASVLATETDAPPRTEAFRALARSHLQG